MTTKKAYRIIVAAVIIAATITVIKLGWNNSHKGPSLSATCFKTAQGWGYNILVGERILIHQPMKPGVPGNKGYETEQQAAAAAQIVIGNIKLGQKTVNNSHQLQRTVTLPAQ